MKSPRIYAAHSTQTSYFTPNTLCKAHNLMSLPKVQNHNASTSKTWHFDTYPNPNSPCAHLFILIIFDPISHIYAVHTQRKVYHSMPLHTYTVNFATSSNLQEILLAYRLHSNDPPFAHLFALIIFEPISHIYATHTSLKRPILDLIYSVKSAIHHLIILIKSKYTYTTATPKALHFDTYPNIQEIL